MASSSNSNHYLCVSCLTPNNALYRQYSSVKSIKLQTCKHCGQDIDPYIERELLLVMIDMVLLRSSAYTHFLFNRKRFIHELQEQEQHEQENTNGKLYGYTVLFNSFAMMISSVLLKTMIRLKEDGAFLCLFDRQESSCSMIHQRQLVFHAFLWTAFHIGWLVLSSYLVVRFILSFEYSHERSRYDSSKIVRLNEMCPSICIPQVFHLVTLFVHMYEDSSGIRFLGSVFVACFSYYSLVCTIDGIKAKMNENVNSDELKVRRLWHWVGHCMVALPIVLSLEVNVFLPGYETNMYVFNRVFHNTGKV